MYQKTEKYNNHQKGNYFNIGWLINGDEIPTGPVDEGTLTKLFLLLARECINVLHALEYCSLAQCGHGQDVTHYHELAHLTGTYNPETGGCQSLQQEIWLPSADGAKVFVAPSIILHYINDHNYLPPQEFLDAVDQFDFSSSWSGNAARKECIMQTQEAGTALNDTLQELTLKTNPANPGSGYLYLPGRSKQSLPGTAQKTLSLAALIKDYKGVPVYLDFDEDGTLTGIEIAG